MTIAYIALGSNLGDSVDYVKSAFLALGRIHQSKLLANSSLYSSAPIDATGNNYVNAVAKLETALPPHELLSELQRLETQAGRASPEVRAQQHNAPRTLDLDILLYGDARINSPALIVPHPRMFERAFVLLPLQELAPALVTVSALRDVSHQSIHKMDFQNQC